MGMNRSFNNEALQALYDSAKTQLLSETEVACETVLEALKKADNNDYWFFVHDFCDELIAYTKYEIVLKFINLILNDKDEPDKQSGHLAMLYRKIAVIEYQRSNYEESFSNLYIAQDKCPDSEKYVNLLIKNDFGIIYFHLQDFKHAEEQFKICFQEGKKLLNTNESDYEQKALFINNILINLGSIYNRTCNYLKAKELYIEGLESFKKLNDYNGISNIYNNLGIIEASLNNYNQGKEYFEKSIELKAETNDIRSLARSYVNLGECNLLLESYDEAVEATEYGLKLAKEASYTQLVFSALEIITRAYEQAKDFEKAYYFLKEQKLAHDEYNKKLHKQKLAELQIKHKTKEHQMDKELYKLKNEELAKAIVVRDKLYSVIAHDLRGPINNIYAVLEMLQMNLELSSEELEIIVNELHSDTKSTVFLLDNLLQWGKNSLKNEALKPDNFNLLPILDDVVNLNRSFIDKKNIVLINHVNDDIEVYGDKNVPSIVLRNILRNAAKFTPDNGRITLSAQVDEDFAKITIKDTGVGMSEEVMEKLFLLEQDKSTFGTNSEKGAGLGLYLSHDYLIRSGGKIEVESEVNKGSTFTIYFPCNKEVFLKAIEQSN